MGVSSLLPTHGWLTGLKHRLTGLVASTTELSHPPQEHRWLEKESQVNSRYCHLSFCVCVCVGGQRTLTSVAPLELSTFIFVVALRAGIWLTRNYIDQADLQLPEI